MPTATRQQAWAKAECPCAAEAGRGPLSVFSKAPCEGDLTLGSAGLGPVPTSQTFPGP